MHDRTLRSQNMKGSVFFAVDWNSDEEPAFLPRGPRYGWASPVALSWVCTRVSVPPPRAVRAMATRSGQGWRASPAETAMTVGALGVAIVILFTLVLWLVNSL